MLFEPPIAFFGFADDIHTEEVALCCPNCNQTLSVDGVRRLLTWFWGLLFLLQNVGLSMASTVPQMGVVEAIWTVRQVSFAIYLTLVGVSLLVFVWGALEERFPRLRLQEYMRWGQAPCEVNASLYPWRPKSQLQWWSCVAAWSMVFGVTCGAVTVSSTSIACDVVRNAPGGASALVQSLEQDRVVQISAGVEVHPSFANRCIGEAGYPTSLLMASWMGVTALIPVFFLLILYGREHSEYIAAVVLGELPLLASAIVAAVLGSGHRVAVSQLIAIFTVVPVSMGGYVLVMLGIVREKQLEQVEKKRLAAEFRADAKHLAAIVAGQVSHDVSQAVHCAVDAASTLEEFVPLEDTSHLLTQAVVHGDGPSALHPPSSSAPSTAHSSTTHPAPSSSPAVSEDRVAAMAMHRLVSSLHLASRLLADSLDIAAHAEGCLRLTVDRHDLRDTLLRIGMVGSGIGEAKIQVEFGPSEFSLWHALRYDAVRIEQVLLNAISNAAKVAPRDSNIKIVAIVYPSLQDLKDAVCRTESLLPPTSIAASRSSSPQDSMLHSSAAHLNPIPASPSSFTETSLFGTFRPPDTNEADFPLYTVSGTKRIQASLTSKSLVTPTPSTTPPTSTTPHTQDTQTTPLQVHVISSTTPTPTSSSSSSSSSAAPTPSHPSSTSAKVHASDAPGSIHMSDLEAGEVLGGGTAGAAGFGGDKGEGKEDVTAVSPREGGEEEDSQGERAETLWVRLRVLDEGPGLQGSDPVRLFRHFEQSQRQVSSIRKEARRSGAAHTRTLDRLRGRGLGLSMVARLIDLMEGAVALRDRKDMSHGAVFDCAIPFTVAKDRSTGTQSKVGSSRLTEVDLDAKPSPATTAASKRGSIAPIHTPVSVFPSSKREGAGDRGGGAGSGGGSVEVGKLPRSSLESERANKESTASELAVAVPDTPTSTISDGTGGSPRRRRRRTRTPRVTGGVLQGKVALGADDQPLVRKMLRDALQRTGAAKVEIFATGEELVRAVNAFYDPRPKFHSTASTPRDTEVSRTSVDTELVKSTSKRFDIIPEEGEGGDGGGGEVRVGGEGGGEGVSGGVEGKKVRESKETRDSTRSLSFVEPELGVVVTDMDLGVGMSGLGVTKAIRNNPRVPASLPVLIISGNAANQFGDEWEAAGVSAALRKPFTATELVDTIREQIRLEKKERKE